MRCVSCPSCPTAFETDRSPVSAVGRPAHVVHRRSPPSRSCRSWRRRPRPRGRADCPATRRRSTLRSAPRCPWRRARKRRARSHTSSVTTANRMPASPARAASTAALSASMLDWNAISSIVRMIFETFWLDPPTWLIDESSQTAPDPTRTPRRSTSLIRRAPPASAGCSDVSWTPSPIDADVSFQRRRRPLAPVDSDCADPGELRRVDATCSAPVVLVDRADEDGDRRPDDEERDDRAGDQRETRASPRPTSRREPPRPSAGSSRHPVLSKSATTWSAFRKASPPVRAAARACPPLRTVSERVAQRQAPRARAVHARPGCLHRSNSSPSSRGHDGALDSPPPAWPSSVGRGKLAFDGGLLLQAPARRASRTSAKWAFRFGDSTDGIDSREGDRRDSGGSGSR